MAENVWYDDNADGTSYRGYGLIADMGPFLYPSAWPLMAPAILDGTYGDVTFYLALPNPADPTNPLAAGDGSYPTDVFVAYRFWDFYDHSTTIETYYSDRVPYDPGSGAPTDFVPGMHLYLAIDWDPSYDGPPAYQPDYYVPPGYASYGSAGFQTVPGQWSDWQPGPVVEHAALSSYLGDLNSWFGQGTHFDEAGNPLHGQDYSIAYPIPGLPSWDHVGGAATGACFADQDNTGIAGPVALWWRADDSGGNFELVTPRGWIGPDGADHGLEPAYTQSREARLGLGEAVLSYFARLDLDSVGGDLAYGDVGTNPTPGDGYLSIGHEPGKTPVPEWLDCANPLYRARVEGGSTGWLDDLGPAGTGPGNNSLLKTSTLQCWLRAPATPATDPGLSDFFLDESFGAPSPPRPDPAAGGAWWQLCSQGHEEYTISATGGLAVTTSWEDGTDGQSSPAGTGAVDIQVLRAELPLSSLLPLGTPEIQLVWGTSWLVGGDLSRPWLTSGDPAKPHLLGTGNGTENQLLLAPQQSFERLYPDLVSPWNENSPQPYRYSEGGASAIDPETGRAYNYRGPPYLAHNPKWRYWQPNHIEPVLIGDQTYMRLAQRADGGGVAPIRRLAASGSIGSQPRSQQADATRRLTLDHNTFY